MKVLWDWGASEIMNFYHTFYSSLALGDEKYLEKHRKKNSESRRVLKRNFNSVKDRQLHAMHNRFGEQQEERPQ